MGLGNGIWGMGMAERDADVGAPLRMQLPAGRRRFCGASLRIAAHRCRRCCLCKGLECTLTCTDGQACCWGARPLDQPKHLLQKARASDHFLFNCPAVSLLPEDTQPLPSVSHTALLVLLPQQTRFRCSVSQSHVGFTAAADTAPPLPLESVSSTCGTQPYRQAKGNIRRF